MQPIVNGLKQDYQQQIDFVDLNVEDGGQGQAAFEFYQVRGHPTVMIILADGSIGWMKFGVVAREDIELAIKGALAK